MADSTITALPASTPKSTDIYVIVDTTDSTQAPSGTDKKLTYSQIKTDLTNSITALSYQGNWNANTNSPTLTSGSGTTGNVYVVNVAGNTALDGASNWKVGDWAVYSGSGWFKANNYDSVATVNGQSPNSAGAVSINTDNVNEGSTNLYFTNARTDARINAQKGIAGGIASADITITGTGLLTGGGNLTANRAINLNPAFVHTNSPAAFANVNYTIQSSDRAVAQVGTMTASRTVPLPPASSIPAGEAIFVYDLSGTVTNVNTLVITRSGADTINGGTSITMGTAYGGLTFTSDGLSKWHTSTISATSGALLATNNLSDLSNVATARSNLGLGTSATQPATAFQRISRTTVNNVNYTAVGTDRYIAQTGTLSATRNWTLPFANTVAAGEIVTTGDESGTAKSGTPIVVQPRLGDSMNGSTGANISLNYAYATQSFISNGSNGWYVLPKTDLFFVDFTVTVSGAISGSFTGRVSRIGNNNVIFTFPDFSGTATTSNPIYLDTFPTGFLPSSNSNGIMSVRSNTSSYTFGTGVMDSGGRLTVFSSLFAANFTSGNTVGISKGCYIYNITT
jgi:hypothetical protein